MTDVGAELERLAENTRVPQEQADAARKVRDDYIRAVLEQKLMTPSAVAFHTGIDVAMVHRIGRHGRRYRKEKATDEQKPKT